MREKVAWASEHGIVPPQNAVQMASEELAQTGLDATHGSDSGAACCMKSKRTHSASDESRNEQPFEGGSGCCNSKQKVEIAEFESKTKTTRVADSREKSSISQHGVGWLAGLYAKNCQGAGFNEQGFLNIGFPPAPDKTWKCEHDLLGICDVADQVAHYSLFKPLIPPPNS